MRKQSPDARLNLEGPSVTNPMPPGWYDDPDGSPNAERRWDGHNWTPERRRKTTRPPASSYPQTVVAPPPHHPARPLPNPTPGPPIQAPSYAPVAPPQYPPIVPPSYPSAAPPPYPQPPYFPAGPIQPNRTAASNVFSIIAFVCAGFALLGGLFVIFIFPTIFGLAGIICAVVALIKKERLAPFAIGAAVAGLVLGWILEAAWVNTLLH